MPVYPIHKIKKNALELLKRIPPIYPYHSIEHTLYVLETSLKIANHYSLSDLDIELIQIAALYHDTGYLEGPKDHFSFTTPRSESDLILDPRLTYV